MKNNISLYFALSALHPKESPSVPWGVNAMLKPVERPQVAVSQGRSVVAKKIVTKIEPQAGPAAEESTYADMVVKYLEQLGIDTVFGVPGGAIEPFLNALARSERRGGPKLIVARHECGAAFMADGYHRETGKMGVVCATTGPGATNLITGIGSAMADEVPLLAITAQTPLPKFGKRALQESSCTAIDTVALFRHCTQFNTLVSHHEQFESKLVSAIMAAHRVPNGPVHISIPSDILRAPAKIRPHIHSDLLVHDFSISDETAIDRLCEKLGRVDTIAMYIGNGAGAASNQIMEFIELTGAAFVTGPMGKTWVDETHPQYRGVYGFAGHDSAKRLFQNHGVDLILAVGAALGELGTGGWNDDLLNTKLVHIDSSVEHFTRSPMANLHVFGNLDAIFSRLIENVTTARKWGRKWRTPPGTSEANLLGSYIALKDPEKCLSDAAPVKPQRLMSYLTFNLPPDARVFVDAGNAWAWATHYLASASNKGFYRLAMGYGSMAWAIGACVGSAAGNRKAPTLCLVGDGSYLMGAQEITVAAQQKLGVVFMVLNDAALGMVMHGQRMGSQESIGWELNTIDYAAMAEAMGIEGIVVHSPHDLEELDIHRLFAKKAPTLIDVRIDRDEEPPMGDRIKGLAVNGSATPGG